jgi:CRP/FNR family cyclic AMP-dependent transcriptional regulator
MLEKFKGNLRAKENLVRALLKQEIVKNDGVIAAKLGKAAKVIRVAKGRALIKQGDSTSDIYFLVHGSVSIQLHGFWNLGTREQGTHVGEMALIDVDKPRSTTVIAREEVIVAKVSEAKFSAIANDHPELWRRISSTLAERLRKRGENLLEPNLKPHIFIGSAGSKEALQIVRAIKSCLKKRNFEVAAWTDRNVFKPGKTTIESLLYQMRTADMAIMVATPVDLSARNACAATSLPKKGDWVNSMRDNVLFELGLFMGRLGNERAFIVHPKSPKLHIPSDLQGITTLPYESKGISKANVAKRVTPVCRKICMVLKEKGQMQRLKEN